MFSIWSRCWVDGGASSLEPSPRTGTSLFGAGSLARAYRGGNCPPALHQGWGRHFRFLGREDGALVHTEDDVLDEDPAEVAKAYERKAVPPWIRHLFSTQSP